MCSGEGSSNSNPRVLYFFTNIKCHILLTYSNDPAIDVIRHILEGRAMNNMQYSMLYIYVGDSKDDLSNILIQHIRSNIIYSNAHLNIRLTNLKTGMNSIRLGLKRRKVVTPE